ncbi:MAG TPA: 6-hydroxymethylpterin diphosphokinase MptE-like protein [Vicinamibacterales bacterium]|nr:6-hydroxymethylpterin diphosphokinase MptE-like protein [Vicinamibacterales bacterium]
MRLDNEETELAGTTVPGVSLYKSAPVHGSDSAAEAARWLDAEFGTRALPPLLIVIGLGEGHLLDVVDRRAPGTRVLALEPDARAGASLLARPEIHGRRSSGRLAYLTAPDYQGADDAWRLFPAQPDAFRLLIHPRLTEGAGSVAALRLVKKIVFGVRANAEARRKFAPRYLLNVVRNIPAIVDGGDVRALAGRYTGVPAIITAAGPSLDAALGPLVDLHCRGLLIACDTTLRPLLGAGIVPHLAVGADPGQANARHFLELPEHRRTWLVAESALDPSASATFAERTLWFRLANHHPWPWLTQHGVQAGQLEMWGSVLTAAFQVALVAGCDPIVIAGADLAFTGNRPYCRGTTYEFDWAYGAAMGIGLEDSWRAQMSRSQLHTVPDLRGVETTTTGALQSFRDWMIARIRRSGRRVINATGGGILYGDGIAQLPLAEALPASRRVADIHLPAIESGAAACSRSALARELRALESELERDEQLSNPLAQWKEFSGEGFDPPRLRDAIVTAAAALESAPGRSPSRTIIPWSHCSSATSLLPRLAESFTDTQRTMDSASLLDALRLLDRICEAAPRLQPLAPVKEAADHRAVSLAVLYAWPEPIRWAVQLFEALIGPDVSQAATESTQPALPLNLCLVLAIAWTRRAAVLVGCPGSGDAYLANLHEIAGAMSASSPGDSPCTTVTWTFECVGGSANASIHLPVAPPGLTSASGDQQAVQLARFTATDVVVDVRAHACSRRRHLSDVLVAPGAATDDRTGCP